MDREQAARRAVDLYTGPILRLSYSYLKNTQDAQDVCQTVLMKLLTESRHFDSPEHEKAWVLRVTANLCKNLLKSPWKSRICPPEHCAPLAAPPEPEGRVMEAVNALPARYRAVICLHYYEGYTGAEIGGILGVSPNTVYSRLARAREKLKYILEGNENDKA